MLAHARSSRRWRRRCVRARASPPASPRASGPGAGAIQLADAPPESRTSTRSSASTASANASSALGVAEMPALSGHRMAGLDDRDVLGRPAVAVAGDGEPGEPVRRQMRQIMRFRDFGHRPRRLAGGENDQPAAPGRRLRQVRRQRTGADGRRRRRRENSDSSNSPLRAVHSIPRRLARRFGGRYGKTPATPLCSAIISP